MFMRESFEGFRTFASRHDGAKLLIHCNQGQSRAPSLALLHLAKDRGRITDESYDAARTEYEDMDPSYSPGSGIAQYLRENWGEL